MSPAVLWEESVWDELLANIEDRRVVPIVGRELLQMSPAGGGPAMSLERFAAQRLAEELGLPPNDATLNDVVCTFLRTERRRSGLYTRVKSIIDRARFEPPPLLRQLAEITDFSLFLTTTFDRLLERAIDDARFGGEPLTETLSYAPQSERQDLPVPIRSLAQPVVYHLLGVQANTPTYVLCDEDLLEWVHGLHDIAKRPTRLFEQIERQNLLIIGEGFSDWLARLFLRITRSSRRLSDQRDEMEVLADARAAHDAGLVQFLQAFSFNTHMYPKGGADFVDELHRRWRERNPAVAATPRTRRARPVDKGKDVFISYASQDRAAATNVKQELEAAGFSVWFDVRALNEKVGRDWDTEIRTNIKACRLFLAVLSENTERRVEGYYRTEWELAVARSKRHFGSDRPFIVPVVVDDTHGFEQIPDVFRRPQFARQPGGVLSDEFKEQLWEMIDHVGNGDGS